MIFSDYISNVNSRDNKPFNLHSSLFNSLFSNSTRRVEGEILRAIPMNYIEVEQFFGCTCYMELEKVPGGYIILEIIKEEESV